MTSLYEECLARSIPTHNHYSDLYIPVTPETARLIQERKLAATIFHNQVEGGAWYDVAFQYSPYWE